MKYDLELRTTNPTIIISPDMALYMKPGLIPETTREIIFDENFNVKIEPGWIPIGTEIVEFGKNYNQIISPNIFPQTVTCVKFGKSFCQRLSEKIPENIKIIHIACDTYYYAEDLEDVQLEELHYATDQYSSRVPRNTTHLYIFTTKYSLNYKHYLDRDREYEFKVPSTVKKIYISPSTIIMGTNINKLIINNKKEYIHWQPINKNIPKEKYDLIKIENVNVEYIIKNYCETAINLYEMKINNENMILQLEIEKWNFAKKLYRLKMSIIDHVAIGMAIVVLLIFVTIMIIMITCIDTKIIN